MKIDSSNSAYVSQKDSFNSGSNIDSNNFKRSLKNAQSSTQSQPNSSISSQSYIFNNINSKNFGNTNNSIPGLTHGAINNRPASIRTSNNSEFTSQINDRPLNQQINNLQEPRQFFQQLDFQPPLDTEILDKLLEFSPRIFDVK